MPLHMWAALGAIGLGSALGITFARLLRPLIQRWRHRVD